MVKRGQIRNAAQAQQLRDFSDLCWGKITPTDIDAYVEFGDRLFVFIEAKHSGAEMRYGQKLGLERLCDACGRAPKIAVLLLLWHDQKPQDVVFYGELPVVRFRYRGLWRTPNRPVTAREFIDEMKKYAEGQAKAPFEDAEEKVRDSRFCPWPAWDG